MYGKKVKLRAFFVLLIFLSLALSIFLVFKAYFRAIKILAKHDENYMPPEVNEALKDNK